MCTAFWLAIRWAGWSTLANERPCYIKCGQSRWCSGGDNGSLLLLILRPEGGLVRPSTDRVFRKVLGTFFHKFIKHLRELTDTFILLGIPNNEKYLIFMLYPHEIPNIHALVNTDGRTHGRTHALTARIIYIDEWIKFSWALHYV